MRFVICFGLILLFLAIGMPTAAIQIPIENVASRIFGKSYPGGYYDKYNEIEVLVEFGIASWYDCPIKPELINDKRHKIKDYIYPAAHKTLPFGTLIKVINPINRKKILCRVIDRGPFIPGRIIDLDKHGAQALGINGVGKIILKIFRFSPQKFAAVKSKRNNI